MLYGELLYKWINRKISVREIYDYVGVTITQREAEDIISTEQNDSGDEDYSSM
ncbi:hypothetical protein [Domibacillus enclensis]|uniref:XkdX family protein n=1 Tax=Domibacillus enclensis TaxID=1017273 RepID=A0A1N6RQT6_9BACI|nr:hypothetical protein [Domibacillus enclensis]SIQ31139.1 hypothetical protein SAMN05443094_102193 [Domibacillus enclensis]